MVFISLDVSFHFVRVGSFHAIFVRSVLEIYVGYRPQNHFGVIKQSNRYYYLWVPQPHHPWMSVIVTFLMVYMVRQDFVKDERITIEILVSYFTIWIGLYHIMSYQFNVKIFKNDV